MMLLVGKIKNRLSGKWILPSIIGLIAFLIIVGPSIINPLNIAWLEEGDLLTHYFGWSFFRDSSWGLPLGLNPRYGDNISLSIVYTDSIPFVSFYHFETARD